MERQFLLAARLIFLVPSLVPHKSELFMTFLPTVLHCKTLICKYLFLVGRIPPKEKLLNREEDITGLLEFTITEGYLMEEDASR